MVSADHLVVAAAWLLGRSFDEVGGSVVGSRVHVLARLPADYTRAGIGLSILVLAVFVTVALLLLP